MADLSQTSWSETDALNNQAAPLGWTPGSMLPTQVEPTAQAMMGAMKRWWNRQNPIYAASLTTTDTYLVSPQTPVTSFTSFELWRVRMPSANTTTSPTITWGPSPATIQKYNNGSLVNLNVGDIQAQYYEFFFNNTVMVMINPSPQSSMTGPNSSTTGDLASYADGTGKVLADSGLPTVTIVKNATSSTSQSLPVFTDTSGTVIGNGFIVGTGPSNLVQLNSSTKLPAVDGSQLTNLNASALASGTVGAARLPSLPTLLNTLTANNSTSLTDTTSLTSAYKSYEFRFINLLPATNSVHCYVRFSTNGGSTYDSGTNYDCIGNVIRKSGSTPAGLAGGGYAVAQFSPDLNGGEGVTISNVAANGGVSGKFTLYNPAGTASNKHMTGEFIVADSNNGSEGQFSIGGSYLSTSAVNAFQVTMSSGNIASGTIEIWGVP